MTCRFQEVREWPEGAKDSSTRGGHTIIAIVKEKSRFTLKGV